MKAIQINNKIKVYSKLPKTWKNHLNFEKASVELQQQEGFFDVVQPAVDTELQHLGEIYWDEVNQVFTYPVINKTQKELQAEIDARIEALDNQFDKQAAKRLLRKVVEPILADEANLTEQDIEDAKMLYKQWCGTGIAYKAGDKVVYNEILYKVIQAHTSQTDWAPDISTSLFTPYKVPGIITVWEQPTAENPYMIGDKVYYPTINNSVYISVIDNNVWSPSEYRKGWEIQ